MKSRTNILFGIGIGFLFVPLLLQVTLSNNSIPVLKGAFEQTDTLQLSLKNVISKKWQQNREAIFQNNLRILIYCQNIWNNIYIDVNGDNYNREYDKIDFSFNIYSLFDKI